mgnify:CR=1 FL=1
MFNNLRKKTKSFTTKIFLLLIAASFALWGVGDIFSNKRDPVIAKIGNEIITAGEFLRTYKRILSDLRRNSNGQITDEIALSYDLHNQTLRQMINEKIVDIEVDKIGISVSKERLRNSIFASPYFKDQLGQFSQEQFEYNLRQLGLDEKEFLLNFNNNIYSNFLKNEIVEVASNVVVEFVENSDSFSERDWKELYKLSEDTFVEETESLKQSGAGAGLTDND